MWKFLLVKNVNYVADDHTQNNETPDKEVPADSYPDPPNEKNDQETPENNKKTPRKHKKVIVSIECHLCRKKFSGGAEYKNHLKSHTKARRYDCSICKKIILSRTSYMKHLNDAHSDENGLVLRNCKYCTKQFKKPSDLVSFFFKLYFVSKCMCVFFTISLTSCL